MTNVRDVRALPLNRYYFTKFSEDLPSLNTADVHSDAHFNNLIHPKYVILSQEVDCNPDDPFKHWPAINMESSPIAITANSHSHIIWTPSEMLAMFSVGKVLTLNSLIWSAFAAGATLYSQLECTLASRGAICSTLRPNSCCIQPGSV
jgi:hypothetical protein